MPATFITARFYGCELATGSQQTFARRGRHAVEEIAGAKCSQDAGRKNGALVVTANFLGEASVRDQQRLQDRDYSSLRLADSLRHSSVAYRASRASADSPFINHVLAGLGDPRVGLGSLRVLSLI